METRPESTERTDPGEPAACGDVRGPRRGRAGAEPAPEVRLPRQSIQVLPRIDDNHSMKSSLGAIVVTLMVGCLAAGCDEFMTMPVDRAALVAACGRLVGRVPQRR